MKKALALTAKRLSFPVWLIFSFLALGSPASSQTDFSWKAFTISLGCSPFPVPGSCDALTGGVDLYNTYVHLKLQSACGTMRINDAIAFVKSGGASSTHPECVTMVRHRQDVLNRIAEYKRLTEEKRLADAKNKELTYATGNWDCFQYENGQPVSKGTLSVTFESPDYKFTWHSFTSLVPGVSNPSTFTQIYQRKHTTFTLLTSDFRETCEVYPDLHCVGAALDGTSSHKDHCTKRNNGDGTDSKIQWLD